jgi:hypothetical protein
MDHGDEQDMEMEALEAILGEDGLQRMLRKQNCVLDHLHLAMDALCFATWWPLRLASIIKGCSAGLAGGSTCSWCKARIARDPKKTQLTMQDSALIDWSASAA